MVTVIKQEQHHAVVGSFQGGFTKGKRTSSLLYIYSRCTYMELFQRSVAPLVLKFGFHQGQTRRKGVRRRGEEEGMSWVAESQYS
jgi:hypothetical protein